MGAVVEIWFESLIPFLLKDSHIVQCIEKCKKIEWKWKLDIVAEDWKSLPISGNHGQVNPKRFIFSLLHHPPLPIQYIPIQIEIENVGECGTNFTHKYSFIGGQRLCRL